MTEESVPYLLRADRLQRRWEDMHRLNRIGGNFRQIAYQASRFDALQTEAVLNVLKQDLDRIDKMLDDYIVTLDDIGREISYLRRDINKLQPTDAEIGQVGFDNQEEVLERLSRLYNIWPDGYRSHNGIWQ